MEFQLGRVEWTSHSTDFLLLLPCAALGCYVRSIFVLCACVFVNYVIIKERAHADLVCGRVLATSVLLMFKLETYGVSLKSGVGLSECLCGSRRIVYFLEGPVFWLKESSRSEVDLCSIDPRKSIYFRSSFGTVW